LDIYTNSLLSATMLRRRLLIRRLFVPSGIASLLLLLVYTSTKANAAETTTTPPSNYGGSSSKSASTVTVRRENNLDFLDSDTLAYYLDVYPGHDVAVMFYATWDTNSHALAPYWNQIAAMIDAGSTDSRIVMGLFDCEINTAHIELCNALSITLYPTLLYIGSGPYHDTDPITSLLLGKSRSAGMMGNAPVPNTVKFQGDWMYYDSILDWIKAMKGLSNWHNFMAKGLRTRILNFFLPQRSKKSSGLPVGVPGPHKRTGSSGSSGTTTTTKSSSMDQEQIEFLESAIDYWKNTTTSLQGIVSRSGILIDALMFNDTPGVDMFTTIDERQAWKRKNPPNAVDEVYRNCLMELSLDYCQRLAARAGSKILDELIASGMTDEELLNSFDALETNITNVVATKEPYCAIVDKCIQSAMEDEVCRSKTCPFKNNGACRYLTACMDTEIMSEYADALGLSLFDDEPAVVEVDVSSEKPKKKWGM
jgi:hypothetical protein